MPGIDEEPTEWFFCLCFSSYGVAPFEKEKIIKSQESENFRSGKNS